MESTHEVGTGPARRSGHEQARRPGTAGSSRSTRDTTGSGRQRCELPWHRGGQLTKSCSHIGRSRQRTRPTTAQWNQDSE
eukprot:5755187-Pyramimonas_sp.AAC.1